MIKSVFELRAMDVVAPAPIAAHDAAFRLWPHRRWGRQWSPPADPKAFDYTNPSSVGAAQLGRLVARGLMLRGRDFKYRLTELGVYHMLQYIAENNNG